MQCNSRVWAYSH